MSNLEPISMYEITAKLFNHISKSVASHFGEQGQNAIVEGIQKFTEELEPSELFSYEKLFDPKEIEQAFINYSAVQEKNGLEAMTMYAIMAKAFAHVSKSVVERFGERGRELVMSGVGTFGEERGRDIARRAAAVGKPNSIDNYLSHYDMGRSDLFEYETLFHPKEIEQTFTKCAFAEQWKKDGMEEYGILYCHMIDPSIAKGFNPNFKVVHDQYVLKEGVCHFRFQMKDGQEKQGAAE